MDTQLAVAIVGLAGGVSAAVLGNWDKLFGGDKMTITFPGYRPTDNFETELRHYFNVSGARQGLESMQRQMLLAWRSNALSEQPDDAEAINDLYHAIEEEAIQLDDVIKKLMPVYQRHFTLPELQELNKFYTTETMQNMVRKLPALAQDAAEIQLQLQTEFFRRLERRLEESTV